MKHGWRKTKPRTPGFIRAYSYENPVGDRLEVEFHFHDKKVKLSASLKEEKHRTYEALVQDGSVVQEKDITAGRSYPVYRKLWPFRDAYSNIPDRDLILAIGGCYEIYPLFDPEAYRKISERKFHRYGSVFGLAKETFWQKYWRRRRERQLGKDSLWKRFRRRFWGDLHDVVLGGTISYLFYHLYYDLVLLGLVLAFSGMLAGLLDLSFRKRSILLTKVLSFLSIGSYFFYDGYTRF